MRFQAAKALTFLGFSEIEALVYCFLLEESPATGYRVSHAIGKPTANTYKAIAALALRGAIVIDDSESRLCRAVPPNELLERLNREFEGYRHTAETELSKIRQASGDDRVYALHSVDQVLERARSMIAGSKQAVLLDLFPGVAPLLAGDLAAAAKRGTRVVVRAYEPIDIKGAAVTIAGDSAHILSTWPGQQVSIAADADQFMTALLSRDISQVHQAFWSNSTFLSCMHYNALHVELELADLRAKLGETDSPLQRLSLTRLKPPGFHKLNERYGDGARAKRRKSPK